MPGFTTHHIAGIRAYSQMENGILKQAVSAHRSLYDLGLQGPDMFFYNPLMLHRRGCGNVGSYMHENCVSRFFEICLKEIAADRSPCVRERAFAYMSGYVCHCLLDSVCHPYIYFRSGGRRTNLRNQSRHARLESRIDALLLSEQKKSLQADHLQAAEVSREEMRFLSSFLSGCMSRACCGISRERLVRPSAIRFSFYSFRTGRKLLVLHGFLGRSGPDDSLNLKHAAWLNPWDESICSVESFPELLEQTLFRCRLLHTQMNSLYEKISSGQTPKEKDYETVLAALGNRSLHSGLPIGGDSACRTDHCPLENSRYSPAGIVSSRIQVDSSDLLSSGATNT